jgi:hypothetical protein
MKCAPSLRVSDRLDRLVLLEVLVAIAHLVVADTLKSDDLLAFGEERSGRERVGKPEENGGTDDKSEASHDDVKLHEKDSQQSNKREKPAEGRKAEKRKNRREREGGSGGNVVKRCWEGKGATYDAPVADGSSGVEGHAVRGDTACRGIRGRKKSVLGFDAPLHTTLSPRMLVCV